MKSEVIEVKSKGIVVDTIEIKVFDTLEEAFSTLNKENCLALINRQVKTDETNAARAAKTRTASPMSRLQSIGKTNPKVQERINAIFKEFGIEATPPAAE